MSGKLSFLKIKFSVPKFQQESLGPKLSSFILDFPLYSNQNVTWNKPTIMKSTLLWNRIVVRALPASISYNYSKGETQSKLCYYLQ